MNRASFTYNHRLSIKTILMSMVCATSAQAQDYVSMTNFSINPLSTGWQLASDSAVGGDTTSWDSANGWLSAGTSNRWGGWYTPIFNPTPGEYYQIQYDVKLSNPSGKAFAWVHFGNPAATYNLEEPTLAGGPLYAKTKTGAQVVAGQLLADNATSIQTNLGQSLGNGWTRINMFTRTPTNATQSFVYFGSNGSNPSSGALIDNVQIKSATHAETLAFSDSLYNNITIFPVRLNYTPPVDRFANLPNTLNKLSTGQNLSVVLLGDSIIQDTTNSYFDVMIERNFPGSTVTVEEAQGHGSGMNAWLNPDPNHWAQRTLDIQKAVYDQDADLVIIGGISNGGESNLAATRDIVQSLKAQGKEVLLTTGCFGSNNNTALNASQFVPEVNGSTTGSDYTLAYRNAIYNMAQSEQVGILDTYGIWGSYLIELRNAGLSDSTYYRDQWTHANTVGKELVGQIYSSFFTPVPEPCSLFGMCILLFPLRPRRHQHSMPQ